MYKSHVELFSYVTEFEIGAGFGPGGSPKKFCNFVLRVFFHAFCDKKNTKLDFLYID